MRLVACSDKCTSSATARTRPPASPSFEPRASQCGPCSGALMTTAAVGALHGANQPPIRSAVNAPGCMSQRVVEGWWSLLNALSNLPVVKVYFLPMIGANRLSAVTAFRQVLSSGRFLLAQSVVFRSVCTSESCGAADWSVEQDRTPSGTKRS